MILKLVVNTFFKKYHVRSRTFAICMQAVVLAKEVVRCAFVTTDTKAMVLCVHRLENVHRILTVVQMRGVRTTELITFAYVWKAIKSTKINAKDYHVRRNHICSQ